MLWPALTSEDGGALRDGARSSNPMAAQNGKGRLPSRPATLATAAQCPPVHDERAHLLF